MLNLSITVPETIVAAAERQLARQGVVRNSRHRQKLAELLKQWIARGLLLEAGEANKREAIAQAVDRINARDAAASFDGVETVIGIGAPVRFTAKVGAMTGKREALARPRNGVVVSRRRSSVGPVLIVRSAGVIVEVPLDAAVSLEGDEPAEAQA